MMTMERSELDMLRERGLFSGDIRFEEPMSGHTSLRIGGPADIMVFPEDPVSLRNVIVTCKREGFFMHVIGSGTNILVPDRGLRAVVISLQAFSSLELTRDSDDTRAVIYAGAGIPLASIVSYAREHGYSGIEALAGIPGSAGGAVCMNAGSFGTEIGDVIQSVALMGADGSIEIVERDKLSFSYRHGGIPAGALVLGMNIALEKDVPEAVLGRTREYLDRKKSSQPLGYASAGCVFKNPEGDSAGRLIDEAGCKGMREGDIEVSTVHANYFINMGRGTCSEFLRLMGSVKGIVERDSGISLAPEIRITETGDE